MLQNQTSRKQPNTHDSTMTSMNNVDDPILRIQQSRLEEAKQNAEMLAALQKKQLESKKRIINSRISTEEARQEMIRESWSSD